MLIFGRFKMSNKTTLWFAYSNSLRTYFNFFYISIKIQFLVICLLFLFSFSSIPNSALFFHIIQLLFQIIYLFRWGGCGHSNNYFLLCNFYCKLNLKFYFYFYLKKLRPPKTIFMIKIQKKIVWLSNRYVHYFFLTSH